MVRRFELIVRGHFEKFLHRVANDEMEDDASNAPGLILPPIEEGRRDPAPPYPRWTIHTSVSP